MAMLILIIFLMLFRQSQSKLREGLANTPDIAYGVWCANQNCLDGSALPSHLSRVNVGAFEPVGGTGIPKKTGGTTSKMGSDDLDKIKQMTGAGSIYITLGGAGAAAASAQDLADFYSDKTHKSSARRVTVNNKPCDLNMRYYGKHYTGCIPGSASKNEAVHGREWCYNISGHNIPGPDSGVGPGDHGWDYCKPQEEITVKGFKYTGLDFDMEGDLADKTFEDCIEIAKDVSSRIGKALEVQFTVPAGKGMADKYAAQFNNILKAGIPPSVISDYKLALMLYGTSMSEPPPPPPGWGLD